MAVQTSADDALDSAKSHVQMALECLSKIVVQRCWGANDFSAEYQQQIAAAFTTLMAVREGLE
jgi:hypothetical protein